MAWRALKTIAWLRGSQRRYLIGASKSELKTFAGPLAASAGPRALRPGVEAKVCAGPDGSETFLLAPSAERQQKEHARISRAHRDRPGEPATTHRAGAKADRPRRRRASDRTPHRPQLARRRGLCDPPLRRPKLAGWPTARMVEARRMGRLVASQRRRLTCCAPICAIGAPRRCGGPISSFPKRKRPFASIKSELIDPSHLAPARGSRAGAHPGVLSRLRAVEGAGAMAEPRRSRQQSAHAE